MLTALLDHLWQSTLFALGVAMLVLAFRRAPAAVRHGLWCAASLKFLIPFAVLAAAGVWLAPDVRLPAPAQTVILKTAAEPFSQAFAQTAAAPSPIAAATATGSPVPSPVPQAELSPAVTSPVMQAPAVPALRIDPVLILLAVWATGSLLILARWTVRWVRLRRAIASAKPVAWPAPMPVMASSWLIEPGLAGLVKPVLIVPETLPARLSRSEIDAIVAHEASHLRRKDNLTAALHMLVEALFWFHPLVWWIGGRLIAEREIACDEAVVRAGHHRAAYARALMESCRDYLQSPLDCMAGASGPDLKTRVAAIMTAPLASPLSRSKKALLLAAGACAVATPVMAGLVSPEVQQAAAPLVKAVSAMAAPARSLAAADGAPRRAVVLAQNSLLRPAPAVDPISAPRPGPQWVVQDRTPLGSVAAESSVQGGGISMTADSATKIDVGEPGPAPEASLTPASTPIAVTPSDLKTQAFAFVDGYAAVTPRRRLIARWDRPICVQVTGLEADQAAAVKTRVEQVARAARVDIQPASCSRPDVEIAFTKDPQTLLGGLIAQNPRLLGDTTSGTADAKTPSRPIQAWYETNGVEFQGNDFNQAVVDSPRQFLNALVIVDLKRTGGIRLNAITDEAAMLALAQPRDLGQCNALPSVTDLFADACSGRAPPSGLTAADKAYLAALYGPSMTVVGGAMNRRIADQSTVASDMSRILPAALTRPIHSAQAGPRESLFQLASYTPSDSGRASDFVRANARVSQFGYTVRWEEPLCVQVIGLTPEQSAAVTSRINAVAQTLSQKVYASLHQSCPQKNVWIIFTPEPQKVLDGMVAHNPRALGDFHSDTRGIKTVTRPIQAWRETVCIWDSCDPGPVAEPPLFARVLVDSRRVDTTSLGAIADYLAMLVLADPRDADHCQVLPSVLDLFAGDCQGRPKPAGLTRSDLAYLRALYTAGIPITMHDWTRGEHGGSVEQIAGRMGTLLDGHGTLLIPGAAPVRR